MGDSWTPGAPAGAPLPTEIVPAVAGGEGAPGWSGTERYAVVRCLGRGGMGVVYEAFDRQRGHAVALKTLPSFDADAFYRLKQEFRALADFQHANLVGLHELVGSETGEIFFTMELVQGVDFAQYVRGIAGRDEPSPTWATETRAVNKKLRRSDPQLPENQCASVTAHATSRADGERLRSALLQLVRGVRAIHSAGKLHRDLKPSNVLVTPEGRLVILDFGVATDLALLRRSDASVSEIVGTAAYMAPEQATADEPPHPASDWYSVGVMLYEALVGRPPFVGPFADVLVRKNAMDPPAPSECAGNVDPDLDALCMALLRRDPAERPDGEEILRLLRVSPSGGPAASGLAAGGASTNAASGARPHLVGREQELAALRDAALAARTGRAISVRIGGASGMGKSSTVHHFLDGLAERGEALVFRGRAYERETVPYKAVDGLIDAVSHHLLKLAEADELVPLPRDIQALGRLFPVLQRVHAVAAAPAEAHVEDAQSLRRRAFSALRQLLAALAERSPLVLFVDDAQWGDIDSAALLLEVLRPPEAPPVLLLMTYRDGEAHTSPFIAEMWDQWPEGAEVRDLVIGPLDAPAAEHLALELLGGQDEVARGFVRAVAREAHGSPFLIEELVRSVRDHARASGPMLVVPTLDQVVATRLAQLPEGARRFVELTAVSGRPLPASVVATASGLGDSADEVAALLRAQRLVRIGVRDGREVVEMIHDRIRETLVGALAARILRDHHGRLATALDASQGVDLEAIAQHMLGAGDSERAASWAERAAEQAASKLAFGQAARLFRLAMDTVAHPETDARRLRVRLAQMLEGASRPSEAADEYRRAARGTTAIERIELERSAAEQLVTSGRLDEGVLALRRVLAAMGIRAPRSVVGAVFWLLVYRLARGLRGLRFGERAPDQVSREDRVRVEALRAVGTGLGNVDPTLGACMQARHLLLAMRVGDSQQVLKAMCIELVRLATTGRAAGARERRMLETASDLASRVGVDGPAYFDGARGLALYMRGRYEEALELLDAVDAASRQGTLGSSAANIRLFAVYACTFVGKVREQARRSKVLLNEALARGDAYTEVCLRTTSMVSVALAADDVAGARQQLKEAMARWTQTGFSVQHWYAMSSEARIELYAGDGARARARIERDLPSLKENFLLHAIHIRGHTAYLRGCCAIASIEADESSRSARVAEARRLARQIEGEPAGWSGTFAFLLRAAAANAAGERSGAIEALHTERERAATAGMWLHAWAADHQLGSLLAERGVARMAQADEAMTAEGVRVRAFIARTLLPGRWGPRQ